MKYRNDETKAIVGEKPWGKRKDMALHEKSTPLGAMRTASAKEICTNSPSQYALVYLYLCIYIYKYGHAFFAPANRFSIWANPTGAFCIAWDWGGTWAIRLNLGGVNFLICDPV